MNMYIICSNMKYQYLFVISNFAGKIAFGKVEEDQSDLLNEFIDFKKQTRTKDKEKKG